MAAARFVPELLARKVTTSCGAKRYKLCNDSGSGGVLRLVEIRLDAASEKAFMASLVM